MVVSDHSITSLSDRRCTRKLRPSTWAVLVSAWSSPFDCGSLSNVSLFRPPRSVFWLCRVSFIEQKHAIQTEIGILELLQVSATPHRLGIARGGGGGGRGEGREEEGEEATNHIEPQRRKAEGGKLKDYTEFSLTGRKLSESCIGPMVP